MLLSGQCLYPKRVLFLTFSAVQAVWGEVFVVTPAVALGTTTEHSHRCHLSVSLR